MDRAPQLPYALLDDPYIDPLIRRQNLRALTRPTTMAVSSETDRRLREILQNSGGANPAVRAPRRAPAAAEAPVDPNAMVQPAPVPMNFGSNVVTDAVLDEFAPPQPDGPATTRPTPRGNPRVSRPSGGGIPVSPIEEYVKKLFASTANPLAPARNRFAERRDGLLARDAANAEFAYEPPPTAAPEAQASAEAPQGAGIGLPPGAMLYRDTENDPLAQAIAAAQAAGQAPAQAPAAEAGAATPPAQGDTPPPAALAPSGGAAPNPAVSSVSGTRPAATPSPAAAAQAAAESVAESGGTPEQQQAAAVSAYEKASQAARERVQAILAQQEGAGISDRDKWLSLALGGARMAASRNPTFFGALGEGAEAGIQNFAAQDRLAKEQARARTGQQLQAEQIAETAGDRAERRVNQAEDRRLRHLERKDTIAARREELGVRIKQIDATIRQGDLSLAQQRELAKERNELIRQEGELNRQSREAMQASGDATRLAVVQERNRAAGARDTRESRWIEYAIANGMAEDSVDGRKAALGMIRPDSQRGMAQTRAQISSRIFLNMRNDPTDKRTEAEKRAAAEAAADSFIAGAPQAPTAPAPAAAPAQGAPAAGNIARPTTPAEAAALPPGTRYITPDGRQLVR